MSIFRYVFICLIGIRSTLQDKDINTLDMTLRLDIDQNYGDQILFCNKNSFDKTLMMYTCEGEYYNIYIIVKDLYNENKSNETTMAVKSRFHYNVMKINRPEIYESTLKSLEEKSISSMKRNAKWDKYITYKPTSLKFDDIQLSSFLREQYKSIRLLCDETLLDLLRYEYKHPNYRDVYTIHEETIMNYIFTKLQIVLFAIFIYVLEML